MNNIARNVLKVAAAAVALASLQSMVACTAAGPDELGSQELTGAPEDTGANEAGVTGGLTVGGTLKATTDVNLRTGPSTNNTVLHVVPSGSQVTVVASDPQNGFYKIKHNGTVGWSFGKYYTVVSSGGSGGGSGLSAGRQAALDRAKAVVGFSYWWGHGRWRAEGPTSSTKGSCSGSCPSCSHGGSYGADCSGFVGKAWNVSGANGALTDDQHPYSTASFVGSSSQWSTVSRGSLQPADALVYNSNGAGHIVLYSKGDGWGSFYAYECKGCSAGCVYGVRTAGSAYKGIRRTGY
jgi:hypothetical protein